MSNKKNNIDDFKKAISSTLKAISKKKRYKHKFWLRKRNRSRYSYSSAT